jgi:SAM-dependent methyltransferase
MSRGFNDRAATLARGYASSMIMPLLMACPLHRRAYEKPLGYAGDYRMMELFCTDELSGDGLVGRFLHLIMQNYSLARAVRQRQVVMRDAIRTAMNAEGTEPVRILALAAGPAIELRRLLEELSEVRRPTHLILLDQDPSAHESAHQHLTRILLERHHGLLPITVQCLHFSVRQLLKPATPEEESVRRTLGNLDLVYSAGLYDYLPDLVAMRLTRLLYGHLRPGGRLLMGNLTETPDSTWMLDYVLGWPLLYRTDESMLRLAHRITPTPETVGITRDASGRCIFLDVTRSARE